MPSPLPSLLTVAAAIAAFNSSSLPAGTTITDTAFQVANNFDALQAIVTANPALITSITFTNPGRPVVPITVAQLAADAGVGALINSPGTIAQRITAAAASSTSLAAGFSTIVVVDSAANVQANIAGIETLYAKGWLGPVILTDAGVPTISLSAAAVAANIAALSQIGNFNLVLTDAGTPTLTLPNWASALLNYSNVVARISTPYNLAFTGTIRSSVIANVLDNAIRTNSNRSGRGLPLNPIAPLGVTYTGYLPGGLQVFDSSILIGSNLQGLQVAAAAGKLVSVTSYFSGTSVLSMTVADATANALALTKFSPNFQYSQIITAAQAAAPPALDPRFFTYTVQDSTANIIANIAGINSLARTGRLASLVTIEAEPDFAMTAAQFAQAALPLVYYGDSNLIVTLTDAGTPTITLPADVLALSGVRGNVLTLLTTPYHLAITGAITATLAGTIVSENTVVKTSLTGIAIRDGGAGINANIGALNTLVGLGAITSITVTAETGIPRLNLTSAQQTTYAAVLAKIVGPYVAGTVADAQVDVSAAQFLTQIATIEADIRGGRNDQIVLTDVGTPTITTNAANFLANIEAFGNITTSHAVTLTDAGSPNLSLALGNATIPNLTELTRITGPFTFSINGPVSVLAAATIQSLGLAAKLSSPLDVFDAASNIPNQVTSLQALATAGKLGTIVFSDSNQFSSQFLTLTAAQAASSPGVLAAIATPVALGMVVTAAQAAITTIPQNGFQFLRIIDTPANIVANLPALEALAPSGKINGIQSTGSNAITLSSTEVSANYDALRQFFNVSITLNDGGTPTITLQNWQFNNGVSLLNQIVSPFKLQIDGPLRANNIATLINGGYTSKIVPGSLTIRDNAGGIIARLNQISTAFNAGDVATIEIRGNLPILSMTSAQLTTLNSFASAITTPYLPSQIITVANLPNPTLAAGFNFFTIKDSVANILANLPALQTFALGGKLNAVQYTDAAPRIVTTAANISNYADFWNANNAGPYPIVLTDAGTPTITVQAAQIGINLRPFVLDAIAGPYALQITGTISATAAGAIVEENNSVLASLVGNFTIADFTYNIAQYYDQLEYLARQSRITSITILDPGGTINVTPGQASADTAITPLIQGSFGLSQTAPCFVEGAKIKTERGEIAVEALQVGDIAITQTGAHPIIWIGHRRVACAQHPRPWDVNPVCVARDAFAPGRPARDLWLSPDHAVFHDGVLIPIRYLINGATIAQHPRTAVTYYHVELDHHDVLQAEGLPTESFLDTGNRHAFANGGPAVMLHPDFALKTWAAEACAPLAVDGPAVQAVRTGLLARAASIGHVTTNDPDLHLLADGKIIHPDWVGDEIGFVLPEHFADLRLVSRNFAPAEHWPATDDRRRLGVAVQTLVVDGETITPQGEGWYDAADGLTWTNGYARIPVRAGAVLELQIAPIGRYWATPACYATQTSGTNA